MEITCGDKETLLSTVRPYEIKVSLSRALNMNESLDLTIG